MLVLSGVLVLAPFNSQLQPRLLLLHQITKHDMVEGTEISIKLGLDFNYAEIEF